MKGWIIFGLVLVLYFVSIFGGFVQDDVTVIQTDVEMGSTQALVSAWTRPYYYLNGNEHSVYRPLTSFSFYLNALITGREPWGFRLGNVLIYGWVCVMVYEALRKLKNSRNQSTLVEKKIHWDDWTFWEAVLYTVLPIHTEVVNNIVGRSEMLSLGFVLVAITKTIERKMEWGTFFLLLGLLSKETALVGVPIVLYLIWVGEREEKNQKIGASVFVMTAMAGFLFLRLVVLGGLGTENRATVVENPLKFVSTENRVMNAIAIIPLGISKVFFPVNLSYDYSYNQIKPVVGWSDWRVLVGLGVVVFSVVFVIGLQGQSLKAYRDVGVAGMMMMWGPILITGNLLFPIGTIFGERLWFWTSLGVVMIVLSIGSKTAKNRTPALLFRPADWRDSLRLSCTWSVRLFGYSSAPILIAILFLYMGRTVVRNFDWLSQERLFLHDATFAKGSVMAQSNAAAMYLMKQDLVRGKELMEKADAIYPEYPELLNNWGMYFLWTGNKVEAKKKFEECLVERPGFYLCEGNLELVRE